MHHSDILWGYELTTQMCWKYVKRHENKRILLILFDFFYINYSIKRRETLCKSVMHLLYMSIELIQCIL